MPLLPARPDEAAVEVMHQVGGAPIEMRGHRRDVRGEQAGHHEPEQPARQEPQHRRIRHVVADERRVDVGERPLDVGELRVDDHGAERHDDPRPGPERVMRRVEEKGASHRILLALGREHPLGDVAPPSRLGAGIPDRPPLDRERDHEQREREAPVAEIGEQIQEARIRLRDQARQAAHLRLAQGVHRGGHRAGHRDPELDEIGDEHAPQPGRRGESHIEQRADDQRLRHRPAEHHVRDLRGREVDRGHDDAIEQQPEVHRPEAAHQGGGPAAVA